MTRKPTFWSQSAMPGLQTFLAFVIAGSTAAGDDPEPCREIEGGEEASIRPEPAGSPSLEEIVEQGNLKKLASLRFPLPPGDFEREIEALARVLRAKLYHAAEALLRYREPSLLAEVEKHRGWEHTEWVSADSAWSKTIGSLIASAESSANAREPIFEETPCLLPDADQYDLIRWPNGISVQACLSWLQSDRLYLRLQAWAWLAGVGISAPS